MEFYFRAQVFEEDDVEGMAVEVAIEVEEVNFEDGAVGIAVEEGRAHAQVGDARNWFLFSVERSLDRVDAEWGQHDSVGIDVGGGKPDFPPQFAALDNRASNGIGPSEEGFG